MIPLRQWVPSSVLDTTSFGIMALMDGCWFLAVSEHETTREAVLVMIAEHIQTNIPNFGMSVVNISE